MEWKGELEIDSSEVEAFLDPRVAEWLGCSPTSSVPTLLGRHSSFLLAPASRGVRFASTRLLLGERTIELVAERVRDSSLVRLAERQPTTIDLSIACAAAHAAIGDVAHDLGGPITSMVAALDSLLEGLSELGDNEELIMDARSEAMRVVELIRRRREALDPRHGEAVATHLRVMGTQIIDALAPEAARAGARIHLDARNADDPILVDVNPIRAATIALLMNAIDASRRRAKEIVLHVGVDDLGIARIDVDDGGRGMTSDEIRRAADLFVSSRRTGAGLGLVSVRSICERIGGAFALDSEQNVGTTTSFVFPTARACE